MPFVALTIPEPVQLQVFNLLKDAGVAIDRSDSVVWQKGSLMHMTLLPPPACRDKSVEELTTILESSLKETVAFKVRLQEIAHDGTRTLRLQVQVEKELCDLRETVRAALAWHDAWFIGHVTLARLSGIDEAWVAGVMERCRAIDLSIVTWEVYSVEILHRASGAEPYSVVGCAHLQPQRDSNQDAKDSAMALNGLVIANQADGHAEVVLKDDLGQNVAKVPNGEILIVLQNGSGTAKVRWNNVEGWAKAANLKASPPAPLTKAPTPESSLPPTKTPTPESSPKQEELLASMSAWTLRDLKKKAREMGVGRDTVDEADDQDDPKQAVIRLISAKMAAHPAPAPALAAHGAAVAPAALP